MPPNFGESTDVALAAAEAQKRQIQPAKDISVPWSKPSSKGKKLWTPEITRRKKQLPTEKQFDRKNHSHQKASALTKQGANRWKKAIGKAQWDQWEETIGESNRGKVHRAMRAPDKPRAKLALADIQDLSTFQGSVVLYARYSSSTMSLPALPSQPHGWPPR